jgi:hypothetical protein
MAGGKYHGRWKISWQKRNYRIYSYDRSTLVKAGIINLGLIKLNLDN